jgi:hypothetical protein
MIAAVEELDFLNAAQKEKLYSLNAERFFGKEEKLTVTKRAISNAN